MTLLRADLLDGRAIALAGTSDSGLRDLLTSLGARVVEPEHRPDDDWARDCAPLDVLVYDATADFGEGGEDGLRLALEHAWEATHAVAVGALIPGERGGKVLLLGPRPDRGPHAEPARAALENLTRTLSIEWARYSITAAMVAPGANTSDEQLATLVAFLASPGGDYFSGCRFELGSIPAV